MRPFEEVLNVAGCVEFDTMSYPTGVVVTRAEKNELSLHPMTSTASGTRNCGRGEVDGQVSSKR